METETLTGTAARMQAIIEGQSDESLILARFVIGTELRRRQRARAAEAARILAGNERCSAEERERCIGEYGDRLTADVCGHCDRAAA